MSRRLPLDACECQRCVDNARRRASRKANPPETAERVASVRRQYLALVSHVGSSGNPEDLDALLALVREMEDAVGEAVRTLRGAAPTGPGRRSLDDDGFSWERIGKAAGLTRQGAQQRWGRAPSGASSASAS